MRPKSSPQEEICKWPESGPVQGMSQLTALYCSSGPLRTPHHPRPSARPRLSVPASYSQRFVPRHHAHGWNSEFGKPKEDLQCQNQAQGPVEVRLRGLRQRPQPLWPPPASLLFLCHRPMHRVLKALNVITAELLGFLLLKV